MKRSSGLGVLLAALLCALLVACSSSEADWQQASAANTTAAYMNFLKQHPNGEHADEARTRIRSLEDDQAWTAALNGNTEQSYQQYLTSRPNGAHAQDARDSITKLQRAAAWKSAQADGSASALQAFLQKYPQGEESDEARAQLDKLNNSYRVQLAAFRSKSGAQRDSTRLRERFHRVLHDVAVLPPMPPDKLYRVTSDPMSEADANSACAKLKKAHQSCKVVKLS
ncbi:MAG TPA: SPOR domain-containing protein [Steroidobacteraceae bacterium]|nr:SPOR domain-containing protein [Steroidobacteraceae bacterium]